MTETYRIEGDYLVTDKADVTWLLRGDLQQSLEDLKGNKHRIARGPVREALKPVEAEAYFIMFNKFAGWGTPKYRLNYNPGADLFSGISGHGFCVAVNALSKNKTCGEIRELIEWSET